jgi:Domain of unknown function (DUF222)
MESNMYSMSEPTGLGPLAAAVEQLATQNLAALPDGKAARRVLALRRLLDRLEGQWLRELAAVDGRGAAGAEADSYADSTAGWLRGRLRAGIPKPAAGSAPPAPCSAGRWVAPVARWRPGTSPRPTPRCWRLVPRTSRHRRRPRRSRCCWRPPVGWTRRGCAVVTHLVEVADPQAAEDRAQRQHERRGLWVAPTFEGMVAVDGLLDPEAGETLLTALEPLARPSTADDERSAAQRNADALTELARRQLEGGRLPQTGGVRPHVTVTVDLACLLGQPGLPGGEGGWVGPLPAETARRLACDATVTRVQVTRHHRDPIRQDDGDSAGELGDLDPAGGLAAHLRTAMILLPRPWVVPGRSRWRWAAPPGSSPPPSAPP